MSLFQYEHYLQQMFAILYNFFSIYNDMTKLGDINQHDFKLIHSLSLLFAKRYIS